MSSNTVYILHTKNDPGLVNRIFGAAIGDGGLQRCSEEMAKYSADAQDKMTVTGVVPFNEE